MRIFVIPLIRKFLFIFLILMLVNQAGYSVLFQCVIGVLLSALYPESVAERLSKNE